MLNTCSESDELFSEDNSVENLKCTQRTSPHCGLYQEHYIAMRSTGLKIHCRIIGKGPIDIVFIQGWTNLLNVYTKQFDFLRD